ncbi:hypothetical protein HBI39_159820 [Parastagonospora nodorum]|nr:hypothetical protein HBI39_159820 [Parastagonospora nodorum]
MPSVAFISNVHIANSLRARTPINLSAVLYEQAAARTSLPAKVSNIDLDFVPSVAFIPDVYIANSLRARTLINLSAVLYEQAAAQTSLSAEVGNIDLNFVLSIAFISNVHMADSLRARTLINLSAVLYEQAAARTSLSAKISNISLRARTLINPSAVLYEQADAQSSLSAEVSIIDLDFVPSVAFDAIGNVELTGDFLTALLNLRSLASKRPASSSSDLNRRRTDPTIATLLAKRIKTNKDRKKSTHPPSQTGPSINLTISDNDNVQLVGDNIEELICVSKVKHTYVQAHTVSYLNPKKYLSNSTENSAHNISKFHKGKNIQLDSLTQIQAIDPSFQTDQFTQQGPTPREPGIVSKSDKVPTQEPSSHIKTELYLHQKLRNNSRKFYRLVITSEDTHYKQTIKKAYIISPERASLILFIT